MDFLFAIILGLVEGLTEFLPVSSTAHLRLSQYILGIPLGREFWKIFTVMIQLGAILAVTYYFKNKIKEDFLQKKFFIAKLVMISFIATIAPVLIFRNMISANLESLFAMAIALILGGFVMLFIEFWNQKFADKNIGVEDMTFKQAFAIGLCQSLSAIFPGLSRSMSTIAGAQLLGLNRQAALEYSFYLSIPTMAAATLFDLFRVYFAGGSTLQELQQKWLIVMTGFVISFLSAIVVIHWFLNWVKKYGFKAFAVYRILIGLLILIFFIPENF